MRHTQADRLVSDYLKTLERAVSPAPSGRRKQLVGEIAEHIAAGRQELPAGQSQHLSTDVAVKAVDAAFVRLGGVAFANC